MLLFPPVKFIRPTASSGVTNDLNGFQSNSDEITLFSEHEIRKEKFTGEQARSIYESALNYCFSCAKTAGNCGCASSSQKISAVISYGNKNIFDICGSKKLENGKPKINFHNLKCQFLKTVSEGDLFTTERMLRENPSLINEADDFGWTALMCSAYEGHLNIVTKLLNSGADIFVKNRRGSTAKDLAKKKRHSEIYKLLFEAESKRRHRKRKYFGDEPTDKNLKNAEKIKEEIFCEICQIIFRDSNHESSTVHLLNLNSKNGGGGNELRKPNFILPESNKGYQIMLKDGWDEKRGLGSDGQGRQFPVKTVLKRDRKGLGSRDAPKPRVTHFGPHDLKAVDETKKQKLQPLELTKRQREKQQRTETEWIRNFRREFY